MNNSRQLIRGVPWKPLDALLVFLLPWVLLPLAVFMSVAAIAPYFHPAQELARALFYNDPRASFLLVILDFIGSYAIIGYYLRRYRARWTEVGFRRFSLLKAILLVLILLAIFIASIGFIYTLVQLLLPSFNPDQTQVTEFSGTPPNMHIYSLLALVIIPPFVEEPVFRGFLFPAFSKRFGLAGGAIISSVLFGFAHLQANVSVYTFVLGLILCFIYVRLGSIIPGIALHMLNNYLAFTAMNQIK